MQRFKYLSLVSMFSAGILLAASFVFLPKPVNATYDGANLIDNSVFLRSNSLSAAEIQSFLASKGGGIANMSLALTCYGSGSREWQLYTAVGAPCGQTIPASQHIYYAAQVYGLNPQVILATMQKEQSLVTTPNPDSWQINQAMGYGCPDNGGCGASYFFYQIDNGTWALRYHYERARGNNTWWNNGGHVCGGTTRYYSPGLWPGTNVTFYDDSAVAYRSYVLANAATAAMYCYTPHAYNNPQGLYGREPFGTTGQYYSGSYNFVYWFERWFGSTLGDLVKVQNGGVYKIEDGVKRAFPSELIFLSYSYKWSNITLIGSSQLSQFPDGPAMPYNVHFRNGYLVTSPTMGMYVVENGQKRPFPNEGTLYSYSLNFSDALSISNQEINLIPDGPAMPFNSSHWNGHLITSSARGMYVVAGGQKKPFANEETFLSYRFKWSDALSINHSELSQIPEGAAMPYNVHFRNGFLVRAPSGGMYVVDNGTKRPFPNEATFFSYGYKYSDALVISALELSLIPEGTPMPPKN